MSSGIPPSSLKPNLVEESLSLVSSSQLGLKTASGVATPERNIKNLTSSTSEIRVPSVHTGDAPFAPSDTSTDAILKPRSNCDVGALIFLLLALPQSISCLVLTSYTLLASFKSVSGKLIARYFLKSDNRIDFSLEANTRARNSYYRSELFGEFLQLFSINSIILLVCHFSLPRAWFQYLIVLAKSIIASRLVGTHATGSTTYVSVVSNNCSPGGYVTTTTTTKNGSGPASEASNSGTRLSPNSFANFITGFSLVVAANYIIERILSMSTSNFLGDTFGIFLALLSPTNDIHQQNTPEVFDSTTAGLSARLSIDFLLSQKGRYYEEIKVFSAKLSWASRFLLRMFIKYFQLSEKSIERLSFIIREFLIVINFAYLVLCIHVISLTISPYLKRIFILKEFSKTLDHLSCITPDVPYGGFKKGGLISSLPRSSSSESVVVINMDKSRDSSASGTEQYEIKLNATLAHVPIKAPLQDTQSSIIAENFKLFCMKPPGTKTPDMGFKQSHNKTIVDRKRSNSTAIPSTTIMDRYFTISTQPIWTWLAATKVLAVRPELFSGASTFLPLKPPFSPIKPRFDLALSLISVEDSKVVFELMDLSRLSAFQSEFSVCVNNIPWNFVDIDICESTKSNVGRAFVSVKGLFALHEFKFDFFEDGVLVGHYVVCTVSRDHSIPSSSQKATVVGMLQSSLAYSIASLSDIKTNFKKTKKEESRRAADLKRQIDSLKSKIDKYGATQSSENRIGGKFKGLRNSVTQLENEIKDLEHQIRELEKSNQLLEEDYSTKESKVRREISDLESYIRDGERNLDKLRKDVRAVEAEKHATEAKLKKCEHKLRSRKDELDKTNGEINGFKKALAFKFQKKQRKLHERLESIIPKIVEASHDLNSELEGYANDSFVSI